MEFKDGGFFLRLGFPSSLIRHKNVAFFLRLGLTFTLIPHETGAFRKRSSTGRNLKTLAFRFRVNGKRFANKALQKRWRHDNHAFPWFDRGF